MSSWEENEEDEALLEPPVRSAAPVGTGSGSQMELLRGMVVRLYFSRLTALLYLATMVLAALLLCATLGLDTPLRDAPVALFVVEAIVTLSLVAEVVLRAIVLGHSYMKSWSNIIDCSVALVSAILFFIAAPAASRAKDDERQKEDLELSQSLVMARIIVQFCRVLLIASHARRSRQSLFSVQSDVSFANLSDLLQYSDLEQDFDFTLLREKDMQERHRKEDYGL
eukprot:TRINITY_DN42948_c0_g1_i1.p1 TRINITY_DN42948_c0_g1~~TRINITY_DN42948_c0_g1_i1.p1  ORF type:complete len:243 (+),score=56.59 TRINITY_DN42948_c0_g1_i1:56-730(+)